MRCLSHIWALTHKLLDDEGHLGALFKGTRAAVRISGSQSWGLLLYKCLCFHAPTHLTILDLNVYSTSTLIQFVSVALVHLSERNCHYFVILQILKYTYADPYVQLADVSSVANVMKVTTHCANPQLNSLTLQTNLVH